MKKHEDKDSRLLNWDPESIESYWQLCRQYDAREPMSLAEADLASDRAFAQYQRAQLNH